jgi:hypothetical protein
MGAQVMALFLTTFLAVFLKAFQQRNVGGLHYLPITPVSFGLASCESFTIYTLAQDFALLNILAAGAGGALGSMLAMYCHQRLFCNKNTTFSGQDNAH